MAVVHGNAASYFWQGVHADRPTPTNVAPNTVCRAYETDTQTWWTWMGAAWRLDGVRSPGNHACNIAGYLSIYVIRESINQAVNGINSNKNTAWFGAAIINLIPGVGLAFDIIAGAADALYILYSTIGSNLGDYNDALADASLFSRITCAIYHAIEAEGQVTEDNFPTILSNIAAVTYTHADVISTIHDYVENLGYPGLAALQNAGALAEYDCAGCTGGTGATGASGPTAPPPVVLIAVAEGDSSPVVEPEIDFRNSANIVAAVVDNKTAARSEVTLDLATGATGDVLFDNGAAYARLPIGTDGQLLEARGGVPNWNRGNVEVEHGIVDPAVLVRRINFADSASILGTLVYDEPTSLGTISFALNPDVPTVGPTGATGATGAAGPTGAAPIVSAEVVTSAAWKGLTLWNGASNDAPPTGWQNVGFDDSAWLPVISVSSAHAPAEDIWSNPRDSVSGQIALFRSVFTLAFSSPPASATVTSVGGIEGTNHSFLNGNEFALVVGTVLPGAWFVGVGDNTIAVEDGTDTADAPYWWIQIDIGLTGTPGPTGATGSGTGGATGPTGATGAGGSGLILSVDGTAVTTNPITELDISAGTGINVTYGEVGTVVGLLISATGGGGGGATGPTGPSGATGPTGATGATGASVGAGSATSTPLGADVVLPTAAWQLLINTTPAAGTYDVSATADFWNQGAGIGIGMLAITKDITQIAVAEAPVLLSGSQSVTTPHVVATFDGTEVLSLQGYGSIAGMLVRAATLTDNSTPATVLYAAQPGVGPTGPTGATGSGGGSGVVAQIVHVGQTADNNGITSTTFAAYPNLESTAITLAGGTVVVIDVQLNMGYVTGGSYFLMRVTINGVTKSLGGIYNNTTGTLPFSGRAVFTGLSAGATTVDLEYKTYAGAVQVNPITCISVAGDCAFAMTITEHS